jgi:hypothetical protein
MKILKDYDYRKIVPNCENDELVDKIANFFETDEHWVDLKFACRINGRSETLRNLLREALKE